jgi:hypothetical protein
MYNMFSLPHKEAYITRLHNICITLVSPLLLIYTKRITGAKLELEKLTWYTFDISTWDVGDFGLKVDDVFTPG